MPDSLLNASQLEQPATPVVPTQPSSLPDTSSVYYKNCQEVRRAGKDPIRQGEPGYGPHLDRDGDGVACESKRH